MLHAFSRRLSTGLTLAGLVAVLPMSALADRDHHRHREGRHQRHYESRRGHSHSSGPAFSFGFSISNAPRYVYAPAPVAYCPQPVYYAPQPVYYPQRVYYYDPYCGERFASLEIYYGHVNRHRHPAFARACYSNGSYLPYDYRYADSGWRRHSHRHDDDDD